MNLSDTQFWVALLQIIGVNIVLSGDNAVVIALAARGLPPAQQKAAVAWGSGAAVVMRIALTVVALELLRLPYLRLVGGALLVWIAVQLLIPEEDGKGHGDASSSLLTAIRTILLADLAMSLDNVFAVAAAAKGDTVLLILGLAISIPLVVFASRLLLTLMERFPFIVTGGAALLGWVAGEMAITDVAVREWIDANAAFLHYLAPAAATVAVVAVGKWLGGRAERAAHVPPPAPAPHAPGRLRRVLLAVDGSEGAAKAVGHALALVGALREPGSVEFHLVNVQRPVSGDVSAFVADATLDDYYDERSEAALAPARALLAAAGVSAREHRSVGPPGQTIAQVAQAEDCDLIVMGSRGLGTHTAAALGSVGQGTVEHATVPVMLVK